MPPCGLYMSAGDSWRRSLILASRGLLMVLAFLLTLVLIGGILGACESEESAVQLERVAAEITPTQTPEATPEPTAEPTPTAFMSRCYEAPDWLGRQIGNGLTTEGLLMERDFKHVYIVDNNDGSPWHFIGGAMYAPGMDGEIAVWATSYLAEPALLLAADTMAAEFSIWDKSNAGEFAPKFDDEIAAVKQCVKDAR